MQCNDKNEKNQVNNEKNDRKRERGTHRKRIQMH